MNTIKKYLGILSHLQTVEVEFKNLEDANSFIPPQWFDKEVTGQKQYKKAFLASAEQCI